MIRLDKTLSNDHEGKNMITEGELAAVVIVPSGYSSQMLAGEIVPLIVIIGDDVSTGATIQGEVEAAVRRLSTAVKTVEISTKTLENKIGFDDSASRDAYYNETLVQAVHAWEEPPINIASTETRARISGGNTSLR